MRERKPKGPLNRAVYEAQAIALSGIDCEVAAAKKRELSSAMRSLFDEASYVAAATTSTGDVEKLRLRLDRTRQVVEKVLA